jgi:ABC-type phosphate/phosphonate transport system substrate-binding protein
MDTLSASQTSQALLANARMYSATPAVKADWNTLLAWVLIRAGLHWDVVDYDAPAPLSLLWARSDLGLAMMCGLPFAQRGERPTLVAAPIPSPARYGGKPVYFTDIVVRADAPYRQLEDTFGGVIGYTLADSMSGGVALRHHLAPYRQAKGSRLYRKAVGERINARGVISALADGRIDAGPLDSYYHDLLKAHDPAFAGQVRTLASTAALPIPPLVATAALPEETLAKVRAALQATATATELAPLLQRLLLAGFAFPDPADYLPLAAMDGGPAPTLDDI